MDVSPLTVSGLQKSYGDFPVLHGLELEITPHAIMGLVGLNGSGKTTTIECLLGLQGFDAGTVNVLDHAPDKLHRLQGDVVAVFDSPSLYPNLTLQQCLEHASLLCPNPVRSVQEVETLLSIEKFHKFKIRQLSLGNKRRASIAQALLGNPKFIILDEPFNGLDAEGVDDVLALIGRLNQEFGTSFLLSSHQLPYL
ncbi:MAG: ABC transporter ATP-binding protein, partial [Sphingomonadales bacterium]|nr:ABC transporter ATP-binding protein [Sphingomonadales bacterium]